MKKTFPEWFIDEIANDEDRKKALDNTLKINDKIEFICPIHGKYTQEVRVHIKKSTGEKIGGCKLCYQRKKRIYSDWFINMLVNEQDKNKALNNTLKSTDEVDLNCPKHGIFRTKVCYIIRNGEATGVECPACGKERRKKSYSNTMTDKRLPYPQWFIDDLADEHDKEKALNRTLKTTDIVTFNCPKHGKYKQTVHNHLRYRDSESYGCKLCANELLSEKNKILWLNKRNEYPEWFINELHLEEDKEKARNKTLTSHDSVEFVCEKHGVYTQSVGNHLRFFSSERASGCPVCGIVKSKPEEELFNYIKELDPSVLSRDRQTIKLENASRFLELDIYSPDKKIAIEYNSDYWHCDIKRNKNYHLQKFQLCEQLGIHLVSIFEKDWKEINSKLLSYLSSLFSNKKRIFARNTIVKFIDNNTAKSFCEKYHFNGYGVNNIVNLGLYLNEELLSVMTFAKPQFKKEKNNNDWELNRLCTIDNTIIIGGASKLFSAFIKKYNPSSITTYSNCCYFTGNVYKELGFSFKGYSSTPYYWSKNNSYVERKEAQPKKLKLKFPELYNEAVKNKVSSVEEYIMKSLGYNRVYLVGNKIWYWSQGK